MLTVLTRAKENTLIKLVRVLIIPQVSKCTDYAVVFLCCFILILLVIFLVVMSETGKVIVGKVFVGVSAVEFVGFVVFVDALDFFGDVFDFGTGTF